MTARRKAAPKERFEVDLYPKRIQQLNRFLASQEVEERLTKDAMGYLVWSGRETKHWRVVTSGHSRVSRMTYAAWLAQWVSRKSDLISSPVTTSTTTNGMTSHELARMLLSAPDLPVDLSVEMPGAGERRVFAVPFEVQHAARNVNILAAFQSQNYA